MIAIFDIDGVLADKSEIKHLNCRNEREREIFENKIEDLPLTPLAQIMAFMPYHRILFITARRDATREKTEQWLNKNIGLTYPYYSQIYMRADGDDSPSANVKERALGIIKDLYPEEDIIVFEDAAACAKMFKENGCTVCHIFRGHK
ncbi:MAG: hypothetical protein LBG46_01080 [Elusimicrobiota bacterium]|jgi:hypothetical protein|nr:hypothetical protein [Elusimicrobiota bacterium]